MITVAAMEIETSAPPPGLGLVTLRDETGDRTLPIFMLKSQVEAIEEAGREATVPRTHDLLRVVLETLSGAVGSVVITAVHEGTFHAELELKQGERTFRVPARPSDAIALAARIPGTPIFIEEEVFAEVQRSRDQPNSIRLMCPMCQSDATFTLITDDQGALLRQDGGQALFRLPGPVEWVCFSCGSEHQSQVDAPPWVDR